MIQPALRRAARTICSASARDTPMIGEHAGEDLGLAVLAFLPADQVVGGIAGEILDRLDAVLAERHQHGGGDAGISRSSSSTPSSLRLASCSASICSQIFAGARLDLAAVSSSKPSIEAISLGIDIGDFLDAGEAFGGQQLADHLVDVERLHEQRRALGEFLLAALDLFLLGQDVDVPAGELGGEPDVLAAAADGQRQLLVGHHDLDALGILVEHDLGDFGRLQRVDDEGRRIAATTE